MRSYITPLFFSGFIFLLFMTSCRAPKDLEFRGFKNITVENIGFAGANLNVEVVAYNPNNYGVELNRTDLDIYLDSTYLGHSSQDLQVKVPRRQEFTVPLKVELDMKNIIKNGLSSLMNKQVLVKVMGKVRVGKAGVYKTFDVNYQTIQQLPQFY
ncbi:MAG: LEA type 2 family protein [Ferruginibacter sp.]